jgi:recombination protein RecR
MADAMHRLTQLMRQLPGIGNKTATRLMFAILSAPDDYGRALSTAIADVVEKIHPCPLCGNLTEESPCTVCSSHKRNQSIICVVEKVPDLLAINSTGEYNGLFHVLGGTLNPLEGKGPEHLRIPELLDRIPHGVQEIIIATSACVEGEATALYLRKKIERLGVQVSRIASGVPVGGELEYLDRSTIGLALRGRREMT